ncbi:MAG: DUF433 domain-containing protein [Proteobacteria bacterium]|nr:DUF433 domain-containing protein [Pseudomonadota bacterium]
MKNSPSDIYGGQDPRDVPAYTVAEAARYLRLAPATLRSWVIGRQYPRGNDTAFFEPLIRLPDPSIAQLSFRNLVEAHVLRALRIEHGISIRHVRIARDVAEKAFGIARLLLSPHLHTDAGDLFLDKYGELVNLSKSGQLAMKKILEVFLKRVERDLHNMPSRLFPFIQRAYLDAPKVIVIDPYISFGRPVIQRKGISTAIIADRIDAGESVENLTEDYNLDSWEIEEAIIYERAA